MMNKAKRRAFYSGQISNRNTDEIYNHAMQVSDRILNHLPTEYEEKEMPKPKEQTVQEAYQEGINILREQLKKDFACSDQELDSAMKEFGLDILERFFAHLATKDKREKMAELREITGAGLMECRKHLRDNFWDVATSVEAIRKQGWA